MRDRTPVTKVHKNNPLFVTFSYLQFNRSICMLSTASKSPSSMKLKSFKLFSIFTSVAVFITSQIPTLPAKSDISQPTTTQSLCDQTIKIRSWKGDYLHRPDSQSGVTTWNAGVGDKWVIEIVN
jgi:hypothetical protein